MDGPVKIASSRKGDETTSIFSPFLFSHSLIFTSTYTIYLCTQQCHFSKKGSERRKRLQWEYNETTMRLQWDYNETTMRQKLDEQQTFAHETKNCRLHASRYAKTTKCRIQWHPKEKDILEGRKRNFTPEWPLMVSTSWLVMLLPFHPLSPHFSSFLIISHHFSSFLIITSRFLKWRERESGQCVCS